MVPTRIVKIIFLGAAGRGGLGAVANVDAAGGLGELVVPLPRGALRCEDGWGACWRELRGWDWDETLIDWQKGEEYF